MSLYVLDTNILLGYVRAAPIAAYIERTYDVSKAPNVALVSVVSKGELYSLATQFGWGEDKRRKLEELLKRIPIADISDERILKRYGAIDAYSQGKDKQTPLPSGMTARNMGKNDLWIAATASVLNATLLTTDGDFDHLEDRFLKRLRIDPAAK